MPDSVFPFRLAKSGFKYLGINIAHNFKGLYEKKNDSTFNQTQILSSKMDSSSIPGW